MITDLIHLCLKDSRQCDYIHVRRLLRVQDSASNLGRMEGLANRTGGAG